MGNTFTSSHRNHNLFMNIYPETQNPLYTKRSMNRPSRKYEQLDNPKTQGCPLRQCSAPSCFLHKPRGAPSSTINQTDQQYWHYNEKTVQPNASLSPQTMNWLRTVYMLDDSSPLDRLYLNSQFKLDPFWRVCCHRMPDVFIEVEHPPYAQNHQWP